MRFITNSLLFITNEQQMACIDWYVNLMLMKWCSVTAIRAVCFSQVFAQGGPTRQGIDGDDKGISADADSDF